MRTARRLVNTGNLEDADYHASLALREYNKAMYNSSRAWRFSNMYAAPVWIYLVAFLVAVLAFYMVSADDQVRSFHENIAENALYAATWGTVGSILRGLWLNLSEFQSH